MTIILFGITVLTLINRWVYRTNFVSNIISIINDNKGKIVFSILLIDDLYVIISSLDFINSRGLSFK